MSGCSVEWSDEYNAFVATSTELPGQKVTADDPNAALVILQALLEPARGSHEAN